MRQRLVGLQQESAPTRTAASLLELDPELADWLTPDVAIAARVGLLVSVESLPAGPWDPDTIPARRRSSLGVLIADGLLSREVTIAGGAALELLGAGDIFEPWADAYTGMLPVGSTWAVIAPAQIAVLEPHTIAAMTAWPQVLDAVIHRVGRRATRLAAHQAILQLPRVEQRILTLLWYLAERWGRVTSSGVLLSLPLSHGALGGLVAARRPTVSLAVKQLTQQNLLARQDQGSWLLLGEPPVSIASLPRRLHLAFDAPATELPARSPPAGSR